MGWESFLQAPANRHNAPSHPPPHRSCSFAAHQFLGVTPSPPRESPAASAGLWGTHYCPSWSQLTQGWTPAANSAKLFVGNWCLKEKSCVPIPLAKGLISRLPEEEVGQGELIQCMQTQEEQALNALGKVTDAVKSSSLRDQQHPILFPCAIPSAHQHESHFSPPLGQADAWGL